MAFAPLRSIAFRLLGKSRFASHISLLFRPDSALRSWGWFRSARIKQSIDAAGRPIPWLTYPMLNLLDERLTSEMSLFEYGAGNSTLYFASRVGKVTSLEHTKDWAESVRRRMPSNVNLNLRELKGAYVEIAYGDLNADNPYTRFIAELPEEALYDVIIIDGIFRNACIVSSLQRLKPGGVMVVDNSDYADIAPGLNFLTEQGFRHIHFSGMHPIIHLLGRSTIFYRDNNCFGM